jgi:hypothetical protein
MSISCQLLQEVPSLEPFFMMSEYDWRYKLKAKDGIGGIFENREIRYPRGFSLGGSRNKQTNNSHMIHSFHSIPLAFPYLERVLSRLNKLASTAKRTTVT